jgi:hypothetical protein
LVQSAGNAWRKPMRRGREKNIEKYIDIRVTQLQEEIEKCNNDYDKQWYNRIISELHWAKFEINNDCWMAEGSLRHTKPFRHLETTLIEDTEKGQ